MLISMLFFAAASVPGASPQALTPLTRTSTAKSLSEFGDCFVAAQQKQSRPLWFVPHDDGGRISNEGTAGVANPYRIRFTEAAGGNQLQVLVARAGGSEDRELLAAVEACS